MMLMFDRKAHDAAIALQDQGIAWADEILYRTSEPTGLVEMWRNECVKRQATTRMLQLLGEEYVRVALQ